jgi:hypothetical protein
MMEVCLIVHQLRTSITTCRIARPAYHGTGLPNILLLSQSFCFAHSDCIHAAMFATHVSFEPVVSN